MIVFTAENFAQMKSASMASYHKRLRQWLSDRNVGWDDIPPDDQTAFIAANDVTATELDIRTEKGRGLLALACLRSGDKEVFLARDDVTEALEAEQLGEFPKLRRLHAIAFEMSMSSSSSTP